MAMTSNIEEKLLAKIPEGWGRYTSCSKGWYYILSELDAKLSYLDPEYKVIQVKEKFGTLRFYFETTKNDLIQEIMDDCVKTAEYYSKYTCEYCGASSIRSIPEQSSLTGVKQGYDKTVKLREASWVKTACDNCWTKKEEERNSKL